jgi:serum/glucocorticoid-regulated kinase 2
MNKDQDFLNIRASPKLVNNEKVFYSCMITKYNDLGVRQERSLVLTDMAIYNLKKTAIQRRIPYDKLESITKSKLSSEFVLHIKGEYDYRFLSFNRRNEIIEKILYIMCEIKKLCTAFKIYEVDLINLNSVMTTHAFFKNNKVGRPSESTMTIVNLEKYIESESKENERKTEMRKRTTVLYNKVKEEAPDICLDDFEILKLLGKGAFGKVLLCQKKDNQKLYAIKVLKKKEIIENDQLEHTKAEKAILQHINHPFLVGLEYAFQTESKLYFVLEFMQGGELFQHLRKFKRFSENQAKFYAACIILALGHLHNKNYIYRDLKLENLLLDEKGYAKLTDFGLAKFLNSEQKALTFCGTPEYLSPEVILGKGHNRPADWWSLGVLIYEMIYGLPPFYTQNHNEMYKRIIREPFVFKVGIPISENAQDLITKLLVKDQTKRIGSQADSLEILSHPWFADLDISRLLERKLKAPFVPEVADGKWEKNFDDDFINEKIRESDINPVKVNFESLKDFQKDFDDMNFNVDKDQREII